MIGYHKSEKEAGLPYHIQWYSLNHGSELTQDSLLNKPGKMFSFFFRNLLYFMNNNGFHLKINDLLCLGLWLAAFQTLSHSPYLQHYEIVIL